MKNNRTLPLCLLTLFIVGCNPTVKTDKSVPNVTTMEIMQENRDGERYLPAVASAANLSQLSFRLSGEIKTLNAYSGQKVKKGDVLAVLDQTDYLINLDNTRARYNVINSQYIRSKSLVEKGLLARSQFDEVAAERQIASANLALAKLELGFTELKAPIDGVISLVNVEQFENIQVGQSIVNIYTQESVDIVVQVPDKLYSSRVKNQALENMSAFVRLDNEKEYRATMKEFTTELDPDSGLYLMTLTMPMPKDYLVLDGMAVDVKSDHSIDDIFSNMGVIIPIEAIFNEDGDDIDIVDKFVWLVQKDNRIKKQRVTTAKVFSKGVQVIGGLEVEDQIVISGVSQLREGMKVNVINKNAEQK